jgi:hypothetical protein
LSVESRNEGDDKATFPADYKITGTITETKGFGSSYKIGDAYTSTLFLRNDGKVYYTAAPA